jgi:hypothetical protein
LEVWGTFFGLFMQRDFHFVDFQGVQVFPIPTILVFFGFVLVGVRSISIKFRACILASIKSILCAWISI